MAPRASALLLSALKSRSTVALALGSSLPEHGRNGLKSVPAAGGDPAWTYSLESSAQPNAARGAAGPGTQTSGNINVNSGADPALTLDPTLENAAGVSANQLVALLTDNNAAVLGVVCEISYTPLYLWPR